MVFARLKPQSAQGTKWPVYDQAAWMDYLIERIDQSSSSPAVHLEHQRDTPSKRQWMIRAVFVVDISIMSSRWCLYLLNGQNGTIDRGRLSAASKHSRICISRPRGCGVHFWCAVRNAALFKKDRVSLQNLVIDNDPQKAGNPQSRFRVSGVAQVGQWPRSVPLDRDVVLIGRPPQRTVRKSSLRLWFPGSCIQNPSNLHNTTKIVAL